MLVITSFLSFLCFSCSFLSSSPIMLVNSLLSKLSVNLSLLHVSSDLLLRYSLLGLSDRQHVLVGNLMRGISTLQSISSWIVDGALLWLVLLSWEQDKLSSVVFQSLGVLLKSIKIHVVSSVINSNTNGLSKSWGKASVLNFLEGESSSVSQFSSVFLGWSMDDGSESLKWSWENGWGFSLSLFLSSVLSGGLVEPSLYIVFPVLSQMHIGHDIVVSDHLIFFPI